MKNMLNFPEKFMVYPGKFGSLPKKKIWKTLPCSYDVLLQHDSVEHRSSTVLVPEASGHGNRTSMIQPIEIRLYMNRSKVSITALLTSVQRRLRRQFYAWNPRCQIVVSYIFFLLQLKFASGLVSCLLRFGTLHWSYVPSFGERKNIIEKT